MINRRILNSLVVFLIIVLYSSELNSDEITIVADEWLPYNGSPNSDNPGYGIEISTIIFEEVGHTVTYITMPWNRAVQSTRNGDYNAVIGALHEDTPDFLFPEEEFGYSINGFFVSATSNWKFYDLNSLLDQRIGIIKSYSYGEELDFFLQNHTDNTEIIYGENSLEKNIRKLLFGRIDVVIEDRNVINLKLKEMGITKEITLAGLYDKGENVYVSFSPVNPKSSEYTQIFSQGIRKLKDSGELAVILNKYGVVYWKKSTYVSFV